MIVLVTLTTPGADTGPFNLYSSIDLINPLVTGISRAALIAGYTLNSVPDAATYVRVTSTGACTNSLNINITNPVSPTTTTTTTIAGTTTTTTTSGGGPTTTTTTTTSVPVTCTLYQNNEVNDVTGVNYTSCAGDVIVGAILYGTDTGGGVGQTICAQDGTLGGSGASYLTNVGSC